MSNKADYQYDLAVFYADDDHAWVHGYLLVKLGLPNERVITPENFRLGEFTLSEITRAITESRYTVLVLSNAYTADKWSKLIEALSGTRSIEEGQNRIIPLLLERCDLSLPIRARIPVDCLDEARWEPEIAKLRDLIGGTEHPPEEIPCPYPGLEAFSEKNAIFFHGRTNECDHLLRQVSSRKYFFVIGPSGSGKSSLVLAGLIPRLRQKTWLVEKMEPGSNPVQVLEDKHRDIERQSQENPQQQHLLLVVDQLEELFTQAQKSQQDAFIAELKQLGKDERFKVVFTMRADFYSDLMTSNLWPLAENARMEITPLYGEDLERALTEPARQAKVYLEGRLLERLLADAADEPGVLSLLQATMARLWEDMVDSNSRLLSLNFYRRLEQQAEQQEQQAEQQEQQAEQQEQSRGSGSTQSRVKPKGIAVAIAAHADGTLDNLGEAGESETAVKTAIARRIFLRLIQFGEGRPDTRRQQPESGLFTVSPSLPLFHSTLQYLARRRLLSLSDYTQERIVNISHEALIAGWPRLQQWIRERRAAELTRRRLETKVNDWLAKRRGLLDRIELGEARDWRKSEEAKDLGYDKALDGLIRRSWLAYSFRLFTLITLTIIATVSAIIANHQRKVARVGELVAKAELVRNEEPYKLPESVLYAVQAMSPEKRTDSTWMSRFLLTPFAVVERVFFGKVDLTEAEASLHRGLSLLPRPVGPSLYEGRVVDLTFCFGGRLLAAARKNTVQLWETTEANAFKPLVPLEHASDVTVFRIACSPEGVYLATAAGNVVYIWDVTNGRLITQWNPSDTDVKAVAFNGDGTRLATGSGPTVSVWDVSAGTPSRSSSSITHSADITAIAFSVDSDSLAVAGGKEVQIVNFSGTKKPIVLKHEDQVNAVAFSANGSYLATGSNDHTARIWQLSNGSELVRFPHGEKGKADIITTAGGFSSLGSVQDVAFSQDGRYLATASTDYTARVWEFTNIKGGREFVRLVHEMPVNAIAFAPNGKLVATASPKGVRLWEVSRGDEIVRMNHDLMVVHAEFSNDDVYVVTTDEKNTRRVWDAHSGAPVQNINLDTIQTRSRPATDNYEAKKLEGDKEETVDIHQKADGKSIARFEHQGGVNEISFNSSNSDETRLITAGSDGTARIWRWQREDLVREACDRLRPYLNQEGSEIDPEAREACKSQ
jgi:WD40 repeat protein/energy-coupling factor transporter ATP-binding protein EcfA2